jgi:hypothetical protein
LKLGVLAAGVNWVLPMLALRTGWLVRGCIFTAFITLSEALSALPIILALAGDWFLRAGLAFFLLLVFFSDGGRAGVVMNLCAVDCHDKSPQLL